MSPDYLQRNANEHLPACDKHLIKGTLILHVVKPLKQSFKTSIIASNNEGGRSVMFSLLQICCFARIISKCINLATDLEDKSQLPNLLNKVS